MTSSYFSQTTTPFCFKWDQAFTENYAKYESVISSLEKKLESKKVSSRYPFFFQRPLIILELNKQMIQLGSIFDDEYERYEKLNPDIKSDFKSVFQSKYSLPFLGLALSGALFAAFTWAPFLKNLNQLKYATLIFPPAFQQLNDKANTNAQARVKQFLNWVIVFRESQSRLEFEGKLLFEQNPRLLKQFRHYTLNRTSPYDIYEKIVMVIREEYPENDCGNITSYP